MIRTCSAFLAAVVLSLPLSAPVLAQDKDAADKSGSEVFVYKKTKEGDLKIHVHLPPGWKKEDRRPAMVFFFGGGWTNGNIEQFTPQATHFAARGMVTARADYRVKSRHSVTPDACVADAKSAVRWLREQAGKLGIDPQRIVSAGGSAGGHIAACTALSTAPEPAGESTAISSKPNALLLYNPVLRFADVPKLEDRLGKNAELSKQLSPVLHLDKSSPPTLLFYGKEDQLLAQGEEFIALSKKLGHRAEIFLADGVGHGFFNRAPWQERTTQRAEEFLQSLGYVPKK